tara:strand:- start:173 stop:439 length:267 start_codon:yes stop_codon:yes gene_type:complete
MPQDYIDTQGLSPKLTDEEREELKNKPKRQYKPMVVTPRRLFTPEYVKEMKILINEILDEREGKFNYTSYFDTVKFRHPITEEEPKYK